MPYFCKKYNFKNFNQNLNLKFKSYLRRRFNISFLEDFSKANIS